MPTNRTLPCCCRLAQGRQRLVHDLRHVHELDVMAQADVEMVDAHAVQADIDTLDDAPGREIEVGHVVATELGAEDVAIAGNAAQGDAQQHLRTCRGRKRGTCR